TALLDSGSAGNFISGSLCRQLKLHTFPTTTKYKIHSITGDSLSRKQVQRKCDAIYLQIGILHKERIQLLVLEDATVDVILGRPWLVKHDPILSWGTGEDCAIDLVPDAPLPKGKIYPLSLPESKAMEKYIKEALSQGYIRPFTSPAASSFLFISKKDGGLRPCIDYRALNRYTIKFRYPLPLVPAALEQLRSARIFTKLDLRSAYNLVRIREGDEWKTAFVTPTGHYEYLVMSYGLVNAPSVFQNFIHEVLRDFLHRLVKNYSLITSTLTNLLKGHPKTLTWTSDASAAFTTLKQAFTQAPLLTHPDPDLPFVVEVDASTTGVGTVLSQNHSTPARLHPCAYFSRKLSSAERNYDIRNRELLAIKLALEEWRHWLEGAAHPFQVLTDHKNLQYLCDAKRLCPCQARWALFFTSFQFTISYRPGSKNVRADSLSHLFEPDEATDTPSNIIPSQIIISPIEWTSPPAVATPEPRTLPGCPPGRQFIPRTQRVDLIHTTHTSLGTGHPGANNTLSLLSECFWWPNMARDVKRYIQGCKECGGKLQPLPIPNCPWSHLGVDFMTDLPPSDGNTCILVIVDRFSKSCRLIPLKGLPTAFETAECLFNQVFCYYGIPEDVVSDRGPQFISRVWKSFFKLLGVTVSLSSGYHPQTNGQTERKIQEVGWFLRTFCHGHQNSWSQFLGWAEYAQNSLRQPSTGLTPFQCVLGFQPPLFPWNGEPSDVPTVDYWFRESERVWDNAHHNLQRAVRRSKDVTDRRRIPGPTFTP
ncbi:hypothetical protein M9458_045188, partial [Cirrhinus mrigala]